MSAGKLPEGWVSTSIENISVKCSQRVPAENEEFIYVDIGSINRELKFIETPQYLSGKNAPSRARKVIKAGDVIVSLTRPNLNAVALSMKNMIIKLPQLDLKLYIRYKSKVSIFLD